MGNGDVDHLFFNGDVPIVFIRLEFFAAAVTRFGDDDAVIAGLGAFGELGIDIADIVDLCCKSGARLAEQFLAVIDQPADGIDARTDVVAVVDEIGIFFAVDITAFHRAVERIVLPVPIPDLDLAVARAVIDAPACAAQAAAPNESQARVHIARMLDGHIEDDLFLQHRVLVHRLRLHAAAAFTGARDDDALAAVLPYKLCGDLVVVLVAAQSANIAVQRIDGIAVAERIGDIVGVRITADGAGVRRVPLLRALRRRDGAFPEFVLAALPAHGTDAVHDGMLARGGNDVVFI